MITDLRAADWSTPAVVLKFDQNPLHHGSLGVIRSLGRLGVPVYGVHEGAWAPAASSRYLAGRFFWQPSPDDPRLVRITDALARDLSDNRRLEQWAAWAGLSPRTLSRRFVAETGMTFAQWRQQARLLRALELAADEVPVTTIALELGYDNVSAFIDMFRRTLGTTPGRYLAIETRENRAGG